MKYCSSCGQCLSDSCEICPVCGHGAQDAKATQENPYEAEKYTRSGVKFTYVKPKITLWLIAVNIIVYLIIKIFDYRGSDIVSLMSMHRGAVASGEIYRIITSIFTHRELFHLLSNCYALYIYGNILEPALGKIKFILIYFGGGFVGNILSFAFIKNPSIGASGAIFGLLGAVLAIYFIYPTSINRMMVKNVIFCVILTTLYSFTGGVNNLAHFGGMFGGYMVSCIVIKNRLIKKTITSRVLMSGIFVLVFATSLWNGVKNVSGANEQRYGDYTWMCFYASIDNYDMAEKKAKEILNDENAYTMDALGVQIVNNIKKGNMEIAEEKLGEFVSRNKTGQKMTDQEIYNDLMFFINMATMGEMS